MKVASFHNGLEFWTWRHRAVRATSRCLIQFGEERSPLRRGITSITYAAAWGSLLGQLRSMHRVRPVQSALGVGHPKLRWTKLVSAALQLRVRQTSTSFTRK